MEISTKFLGLVYITIGLLFIIVGFLTYILNEIQELVVIEISKELPYRRELPSTGFHLFIFFEIIGWFVLTYGVFKSFT